MTMKAFRGGWPHACDNYHQHLSFIGTNIDDTFVLAVWFSQVNGSLRRQDIVFGQLIGSRILVLISVFAAYGLSFLPTDRWLAGCHSDYPRHPKVVPVSLSNRRRS